MPTVEIPFGSTVYDPATNYKVAGNRFYVGNVSGTGYDYADLIDSHTGYTDVAAMSSDDTATYAWADSAGFNTDMQARYPTADPYNDPYYLTVRGKQDTPYTLPADVTEVVATAVVTARNTGRRDILPSLYGTVPGPVAGQVIVGTGSWTDWVKFESLFSSGNPMAASWFRDDLAAGKWVMALEGAIDALGSTDVATFYVAYMALRLSWGGVAPAQRLYPRNDGLGLSSGQRIYPPPRSRQRSGRLGPAGYL